MSEKKISHKFSTRYNPLYATWHTMKERCYLKTYHKYPDYGGRGIKICDEWLGREGFKNFCKWSLSYGWHRGLSLDRIDNDGDYSPDNCRWVTIEIQNNNKRTNRRVIFWDMEFTIPQLAQFVDVDYEYLRKCIIDDNMAINDAVDKSVEKAKPYVPYRQLNSVVKKNIKIQETEKQLLEKEDVMTLYSKATHINPRTGFEVSDETMTFFGHNIREDDMNYYVSSAWSTDNMTEKVYPKSDWKCLD